MCAPIWLKLGTHIGGLKANTKINFGVNLINIEGGISDFMHKAKVNFCQPTGLTASNNKLRIGI